MNNEKESAWLEEFGELEEMARSRNSLQPLAMTCIYDALTYIYMDYSIDVKDIVSGLCNEPYEDCPLFVKQCMVSSVSHFHDVVDAFKPHLRNWRFERLPRLEQAILIQAYVHYYYVDDHVDKGVVIDIAVKLAKKYLSGKDYRFVNAILDNVLGERNANA